MEKTKNAGCKLFGFLTAAILCMALAALSGLVFAAQAENITGPALLNVDGATLSMAMQDGSDATYGTVSGGKTLTVESTTPIAALYVKFWDAAVTWKISNGTTSVECGTNGFLHEYVDIAQLFGGAQTKLSILFSTDANLCDLYLLSAGDVPDWVQVWSAPCEKADIMLISTHSDDEQLFFAGLLPYCADKGLYVQVVYFTNHNDNPARLHEQINGLWTVGIRNYPVISSFPDLYSESVDAALSNLSGYHYTEEDCIAFQVENIRRFKPMVIVGHDVNGEYGHGAHMLNTATLMKALEVSADAAQYPDSAAKYGVWDVPKTYLHLYDQNKITLDWDEPLTSFNGKTAFEVSKEGYACHDSQQYTWFTAWLKGTDAAPITKASQIATYSPCQYGLYRTTVGADTGINDLFENVTLYSTLDAAATPVPSSQEASVPGSSAAASESAVSDAVSSAAGNKVQKGIQPLVIAALVVFIVVCAAIVLVSAQNARRRSHRRRH